ncbi:MAG: pyridoxamine 5'-phosphate oxidase family protein [Ilumatobacteraceae bacterium]
MPATAHQLPTWECIELLRDHGIGRMCLLDGAYPIAVPINYRVVNDAHGQPRLVVRTTPDALVGKYRGPCALEVDEIDLPHERAWSIIARGTLVPVHGHHELPDPAPIVGGNRSQWMTVDIVAITGRRFVLSDAGDGWSVDWQIT